MKGSIHNLQNYFKNNCLTIQMCIFKINIKSAQWNLDKVYKPILLNNNKHFWQFSKIKKIKNVASKYDKCKK